jgi:hypothetical protein
VIDVIVVTDVSLDEVFFVCVLMLESPFEEGTVLELLVFDADD